MKITRTFDDVRIDVIRAYNKFRADNSEDSLIELHMSLVMLMCLHSDSVDGDCNDLSEKVYIAPLGCILPSGLVLKTVRSSV